MMNGIDDILYVAKLNDILKSLDVLLSKSIEINNEIFKFSFRKIMPLPFMFKRIDFHNCLVQGESIANHILDIQKDLDKLSTNVFDPAEQIGTIKNYTIVFYETQVALNNISVACQKKTEGEIQLKHERYKELVAMYNVLNLKRSEVGLSLNQVVNELNLM